MSRPLRIEYKDAWYHVMNRGKRGDRIFLVDKDYHLFLKVLQEAVQLWNVNICAYCLMPNHYHLLIQTPDANLSRCMRHINGVYTQRFNRRYRIDGPLFRGRFKSILIGDETYLIELLRYICFNPVQAGIVTQPQQYQWSSFNEYLADKKQNDWLNRELILNRFIQKKKKGQMKGDLLSEDAKDDIYKFFNRKNLPSLLGSREFIDQIRNRFFEKMVHREIPAAKELALESKSILKVTCEYFGINEEEMVKAKRGLTNTPRDVAIYLIRTRSKLGLQEISKIFHFSNYSGASSAIERIKERIQKESSLKADLDELEKKLD